MNFKYLIALSTTIALIACGPKNDPAGTPEPVTDWSPYTAEINPKDVVTDEEGFKWQTEQFADIRIVRYQIPGWDNLTPKQQELVYCLTQAGLCGRDIMYDQNYRFNLEIREALEHIYQNYSGDKGTVGWNRFETYLKRVWFSNGIHHHYSNAKLVPGFEPAYMDSLMANTGTVLSAEARTAIFDPTVDNKKVEQSEDKGLVEGSAINFYAPDVTTAEAKAYYASLKEEGSRSPMSYGINSRLIKNANGEVEEEVYKVGGLYSEALEQVVFWLKKAEQVAENDKQAAALRKLIGFYETGDLRTWDLYNINWVQDTEGDIDYINGFVEVYNDPLGYTGSYETIVEIKDFEASKRMENLMQNAQWFEDNSPFLEEHKKAKVVGILYNVVNVVGEAGDASPSTPIGVNLPNANWIRVQHGSKSVSLGNIVEAYSKSSGSGLLEEFAHDQEEIDRAKAHSDIADKLHTAMHEVIGHASGQIEEGVGVPAETLMNYSSTIEEGRADLVALYYLMDPKLVELGLMESLEVGKESYDSYIRNGMLAQLRRLDLGDEIQEAHMRNRAWIAHWVFEKGQANNVIAEVIRDGKTYYDIQDYDALRTLFGELLREVQRIKSKGDFAAAEALVEGYGVKVDQAIHKQVIDRASALGTAPYGGFINPRLVAETDSTGKILSVKVEYPDDFTQQMLEYSSKYSFLLN
jgi:dipeptidyl-peptidase III